MNEYTAPLMELEEIEMNNVLMASGVTLPVDTEWGDETEAQEPSSEL